MTATAEEILREKFKNSFLDVEYIDLILEAMEEYANQNTWVDAKLNPPTKYGKYRVYRKSCDKVHDEVWNGTGWAYNNNTITHYQVITKPTE